MVDPAKILHRQSAVKDMVDERRTRDSLGELLSGVLDIERLTAKAVYGTANASDLKAIGESIKDLPEIKYRFLNLSAEYYISREVLNRVCAVGKDNVRGRKIFLRNCCGAGVEIGPAFIVSLPKKR